VKERWTELIQKTYGDLEKAWEDYTQAALRRMEAREALDMAFAVAYGQGKITGRNEQEREAQLRNLFPEVFEAVYEAEKEVVLAKGRLEQAKARAEALRLTLEGDGDR